MSNLLGRLPRPASLLMFEAASRHLSFTLAARELKVTQAAVSQQVRGLEKELGLALFNRLHQGLELTDEGRQLYRAVSMALGHVAGTIEDLRDVKRAAGLTVGMTFAMTTFWLLPRLHEFRALHPQTEVHVVATDSGFEKVAGEVDAGIAFGLPPWPGFAATPLHRGEMFPVCSPGYLRQRGPFEEVRQMSGATLLEIEDDRPDLFTWPRWLAALGITDFPRHASLRLNNHSLQLQAACEGQGIALSWALLTDDLIRSGKLVRPVKESVTTPEAFYFLISEKTRSDAVSAFRDWVLASAKPSAARSARGAGRRSA